MLPSWRRLLIYKTIIEYPNSLAIELDTKRTLLIATDETKINAKSGGGYIDKRTTGNITTHERKPIIGNLQSIHSHISEIYDTLALFILLNEYCKYYLKITAV